MGIERYMVFTHGCATGCSPHWIPISHGGFGSCIITGTARPEQVIKKDIFLLLYISKILNMYTVLRKDADYHFLEEEIYMITPDILNISLPPFLCPINRYYDSSHLVDLF